MVVLLRVLVSLVCLAVLLFSAFGFLATFEPLTRSVQMTWRAIYSFLGLAAVAGLVWVNRRRSPKRAAAPGNGLPSED